MLSPKAYISYSTRRNKVITMMCKASFALVFIWHSAEPIITVHEKMTWADGKKIKHYYEKLAA
jgi:hypothetical protein